MARGVAWQSSPEQCDVPTCERPALSTQRGGRWLCHAHEWRLQNKGDVLAHVPIRQAARVLCTWPECDRPARRASGSSHYRNRCEEHRRGTPHRCEYPGCERYTGSDRFRHPHARCRIHRGLKVRTVNGRARTVTRGGGRPPLPRPDHCEVTGCAGRPHVRRRWPDEQTKTWLCTTHDRRLTRTGTVEPAHEAS